MGFSTNFRSFEAGSPTKQPAFLRILTTAADFLNASREAGPEQLRQLSPAVDRSHAHPTPGTSLYLQKNCPSHINVQIPRSVFFPGHYPPQQTRDEARAALGLLAASRVRRRRPRLPAPALPRPCSSSSPRSRTETDDPRPCCLARHRRGPALASPAAGDRRPRVARLLRTHVSLLAISEIGRAHV